MPWVRLHGTKDYLGMALHLEEVPEFRCTINLVPSLLVQLEAYVRRRDRPHLDVSRLPADGLGRDDAIYLLDNFFMAHRRLDDPAAPALPRALPAARRWASSRPSRRCPGSASATSATSRSGRT